MPKFTGGSRALRTFVGQNVIYPASAIKNKIEGTVYVKFVVNKKGKVKNVQVQKGISKELDAAAIKAISSLPNFEKPGINKKGKPVNVWYSMPVTFRLKR